MFRIIHPKYLRAILPAILICATLLVATCNNDTTKETKSTDTTVLKDNTDMTADTLRTDTLVKDTTKGEQTPPPR